MVSLVTGASRGIGRGIALELARAGHDLVINYAGNTTAARQTAIDCAARARKAGKRIRVELAQADVASPADRQRLMELVRSKFGRLDVLINNAGIASIGRPDLLEATEEKFDRLMAVNLKGPFFLTQLAARLMIEQGERRPTVLRKKGGNGRGAPRIIFISSISAFTVSTNRGDYCIAKAGMGMVTQLYAARLAEHGIGVFEIRPGIIASDMTAPVKKKYDRLIKGGLTPIARWGTPEDVGRAVAMLAGDSLPFSTGDVIHVDGGFHIRRL